MAANASSSLIVLAADAILFGFFLVVIVAAPLLDAQAVLPATLFPEPLLRLHSWYADRFGDYLTAERPLFFVGLVWLELLFQWPLAIANAYAILARRPWYNTTCVVYGSSMLTSMAAIMSELVLSGRASHALLQIYYPFVGLALLSVVRGLVSCGCTAKPTSATIGRKKRA